MLCIYIMWFPDGKGYCGQTNNLEKRKTLHRKSAKYGKSLIHHAVRKFGWNNIRWQVLFDGVETEERLNELEVWTIEWFNLRSPNGYNKVKGGCNSNVRRRKQTAEAKEKIRKAAFEREARRIKEGRQQGITEEGRKKISKAVKRSHKEKLQNNPLGLAANFRRRF